MSAAAYVTLASTLRACADAVEALAVQGRRGASTDPVVMLTPEEACALVAGRTPDGKLRVAPSTLARRTRGQDFRRGGQGRPLTYERAGLERWLRAQQ